MRRECGSNGRDGGRESRPREHGEEGRKEGSARGGGGGSLKKRCLMFGPSVWLPENTQAGEESPAGCTMAFVCRSATGVR